MVLQLDRLATPATGVELCRLASHLLAQSEWVLNLE